MSELEVGKVAKPHGIRGEVKVQLHFSGSTALFEVERVLLRWPNRQAWLAVSNARPAGKQVVLTLEGVADRDAAEALRGAAVLVDRASLPELGEDEYYLADLVGATVTVGDTRVGEVVEVRTHPSADTIVIVTPEGKRVEQPLVEPWLDRIDVGSARIELTSTDGLIS